jgi:Cell wall-active antibiotics response LiaF, C-terminal
VQVQEYSPSVAPLAPNRAPMPTPGPASPPRRPQSPLGGVVVSVAVIAVGLLGLLDLAGTPVSASAYFAVPLTVIGTGLVIGAWFGHARRLIAVGAVLCVALGIATASEELNGVKRSANWRPTSIEQLDTRYTIGIGSAVLDLSLLDFAGFSKSIEVNVDMGDLTIIVPPTVDVRAEASVDVGDATVFGTHWGGIGQSTRTVTDDGVDGPGGGELVIRASVDVGNVEVRR